VKRQAAAPPRRKNLLANPAPFRFTDGMSDPGKFDLLPA
jgi:hypothetical protein